MKNICLAALIILILTVSAQAQCVGEIKDVVQDEERGSIIVVTEYKLNDVVIQTGQTRYLETSGTNEEIIAKAKADVLEHCKNLVMRIPANQDFIKKEILKKQKGLTASIIQAIKDSLVGQKQTVTEVNQEFKGITIKVTTDEKNSTGNIIP